MATHRYLQCAFWTDPFILGLTPEEKYFYIYLMTNPHTRQCGVYELPEQLMMLETGYNNDTLIKLINRFIEYRKIAYSSENNEVMLLNWLNYNSPNSPPVIKCIIRELSTIKTIEFKRQIIEILHKKRYALDITSIPPTGDTIKELKEKELKLNELNASGGKVSDPLEWERQKEKVGQPLFKNLPQTPKRKKELTPSELSAKVLELESLIAENRQVGKSSLVAEFEAELATLLANH